MGELSSELHIELESEQIERLRRRAIRENMARETIEVEIIRPAFVTGNLKFRIDYCLVNHWVKSLLKFGDEFRMTNIQTGAMIWSKTLPQDMREIILKMGSKQL